MFKLSDVFSNRTSFECKESVIDFIKNSKKFDENKEDIEKADAIIIFMTSRQITWLVTTEKRLYCILDDVETRGLHINWSIPKNDIVKDNEIILKIESTDHSQNSGLVDIGDKHKRWFYSKKLCQIEPIETRIRNLITKHMIGN